jgi:hypothetical protein
MVLDPTKLTNGDLRQQMGRLIDVSEPIQSVWIYKHPLIDKTKFYVPEFKWAGILHHAFVIFKTPGWWWSIEKDTKCVLLQRSKEQSDVLKKKLRYKVDGSNNVLSKFGGSSFKICRSFL